MRELLSGMIASGYLVGALYFAKFWSRSRDRLFAILATSFVILAAQRVLLVAWADDSRFQTTPYILRLAAFVLILLGIVDKNR
jgi:hypothetical protein